MVLAGMCEEIAGVRAQLAALVTRLDPDDLPADAAQLAPIPGRVFPMPGWSMTARTLAVGGWDDLAIILTGGTALLWIGYTLARDGGELSQFLDPAKRKRTLAAERVLYRLVFALLVVGYLILVVKWVRV